MSEIVDQTLKRIVKGSSIVLVGTLISMPLGFVAKLVVIRNTTQSEYGMYSLGLVLLIILITVSLMGLQEGSTRFIAYYRGKSTSETDRKIKGIMCSAFQMVILSSVVWFIVVFFLSNSIASHLFHMPEFSAVLRWFSVSLPFMVIITMVAAVFRGFGRVEPNIYFEVGVRQGLFILFLTVSVVLEGGLLGIVYAYVAAAVLACLGIVLYLARSSLFEDLGERPPGFKRELLGFSLPLLSVTVLNMVMQWTDTIMLGSFKTSDVVAVYNAALPLARLIPLALSSSTLIFVPIMSELFSMGLTKEMKRTYQIVTRWGFSLAVPLFSIFFVFPVTVLQFFFGVSYGEAALPLQILSCAFMAHTITGLNGLTLTVMGNTRFVMVMSLMGAGSNVILNYVLIPPFGTAGAALAFLCSVILANVMGSIKLYRMSGIHPFTLSYAKPLGISGLLLVVLYGIGSQMEMSFGLLLLFGIGFLGGFLGLLLLTRSFDREDIEVLLAIERKSGVNLKLFKNVLRRFVK
ncbi:MAG: flippase [Theionarchaea archaeon]|nr:flippase [Theionarchaea archaeon]MBU7036760.1 flippase [Theionarchaea archaeon]